MALERTSVLVPQLRRGRHRNPLLEPLLTGERIEGRRAVLIVCIHNHYIARVCWRAEEGFCTTLRRHPDAGNNSKA